MPSLRVLVCAVLLLAAAIWPGPGRAASPAKEAADCDSIAELLERESQTDDASWPSEAFRCSDDRLQLGPLAAETKSSVSLDRIADHVRDSFEFYGLAGFYSSTQVMLVNADGVRDVRDGDILGREDWLSVAGRFKVFAIQAPGAALVVGDTGMQLQWQAGSEILAEALLGTKTVLADVEPALDGLRYRHLWDWLAAASRAVEWSLLALHARLGWNWGWIIVLFAIIMKLLLLPVSVMTLRLQRSVSRHQTELEPVLKDIKAKYDGEAAHHRIMEAHRRLGITPFFTLKPLLGSFIQVPILVAIFNALGEMPQLAGEPFLWIQDLAYPDSLGKLPFAIPLLGDTLSLLPLLMTMVTVASTLSYINPHAPLNAVRSQKNQLYLMAAGFFVLFYPFPASMVLYWTMANILQWAQQQLIRI